MTLQRIVIPPLGIAPRDRATLLTSIDHLPPDLLMEGDVPRWLAGVTFQALGCNPLTRIESIACGVVPVKTANTMGDVIGFDSFTIYDAIEGSLLCTDILRLDSDVEIRMPAMVSEQLANELMAGGARAYNGASPDVNPSFVTSASVVTGGPYLPNEALALLEQGAADLLHGGQATLHLTPRGFSSVNGMDQAENINGRWVTAQGHVVIADAGYDGTEPDANAGAIMADEWWYMSGPVFFALTQPEPLGMPYERVDYATNQLTNIYEGYATVVFDPCAILAVPVSYLADTWMS